MSKRNNNSILIQGTILAGAQIVCRLIGLFYRIPLVRIVGDQGMGYYGYAYDIYQVLLLISSNAIPLAVSMLVSKYLARREYKNLHKIFISSMIFSTVIGTVLTVFTLVWAEWLCKLFGYRAEVTYSLRVLAPTILLSCILGVYRGYFQGKKTMMPTAISQIIEQIINAAVSIIAAYLLVIKGPEFAAAGGTLGTTVGALCSVVFLVIVYQLYKPTLMRMLARDKRNYQLSHTSIYKMIVLTMAPVVVSSALYQVIGLLDSSLYSSILSYLKYDNAIADSMYGVYSSQFKTLTNIPIAISGSIGLALIPAITSARTLNNTDDVRNKSDSTIRLVMVITMPCVIGLMVLAKPIISLLFGSSNDLPVRLLQVGSITVALYAYSTVTMYILQGLNKMKETVINSFISLVIHTVFVVVLLLFSDLNIYALVYGTAVFSFSMSILNIYSLKKAINYDQEIKRTFLIPTAASIIMGIVVFVVYKLVYYLLPSNLISVMLSIVIGVVIFGICEIVFGGLTENELMSLPKGYLIVNLCKRFRLL